ncbi:hypothetical protein AAFF_G00022480 [Aldrovandia affinis]|uniref:Uncharacterized protein n=1 Tax=Aldrovandia affinis TaxID=143900 RepID=A0AAD7T5F1_9TELE|nr:hypothetical protein AAFF_G00022480 [Aldrovandia affinis]
MQFPEAASRAKLQYSLLPNQPSTQRPAPIPGSIQRRETKIIVRTAASVKTRILTGPLENIVLNIVQARYRSLSKSVMSVPGLSHLVVNEVLKRVKKECKQLTSLKFNSVLRQTAPSALKDFQWMKVWAEWRTTAPTFLRFLEFASAASIETATAEGKQPGMGKKCVMAMAGAALLRARANHMCAPMYRNSLVMHHGRARKRCFEQFARLGICVSHASTLQKFKEMDHKWDSQFLQWKHNVCQAYPTTQHQAEGSATLSTLRDVDSSDENQDKTDSGQGHLDTRHTTNGSSLSESRIMQQSDDQQDQSSRARNAVWEIEVSLS